MTQREDKDKSKAARENLGKYFYDLSKVVFTIMVAGNAVTIISDGNFNIANFVCIISGAFLTLGFAFLANKVLKK